MWMCQSVTDTLEDQGMTGIELVTGFETMAHKNVMMAHYATGAVKNKNFVVMRTNYAVMVAQSTSCAVMEARRTSCAVMLAQRKNYAQRTNYAVMVARSMSCVDRSMNRGVIVAHVVMVVPQKMNFFVIVGPSTTSVGYVDGGLVLAYVHLSQTLRVCIGQS